MERKVRVLHYNGIDHTVVFNWTTHKAGNTSVALQYLMKKFRENPPSGYDVRAPKAHDRLEITDENNCVYLYQYTSTLSVRQI